MSSSGGALGRYKSAQTQQKKRADAKKDAENHITKNGKRKKISELTDEEARNLTDEEVEQYMMEGTPIVVELIRDKQSMDILYNMGVHKYNETKYGGKFSYNSWVTMYRLFKQFKREYVDYTKDPAFADIIAENPTLKIKTVNETKQIPFPKFDQNIFTEEFRCGYANWDIRNPAGFVLNPDGFTKYNDLDFYYTVSNKNEDVFKHVEEIAKYVVTGRPVPQEIVPTKTTINGTFYIDDQSLQKNLVDFIRQLHLDGVAKSLATGWWHDGYLPIGALNSIINTVIGENNYAILLSNVHERVDKAPGKNGAMINKKHYICRGMFIDTLGNFKYGQVDITCEFGNTSGKVNMRHRSVQHMMKRTLIMAAYPSLKSLKEKEMDMMKRYVESLKLGYMVEGRKGLIGGQGVESVKAIEDVKPIQEERKRTYNEISEPKKEEPKVKKTINNIGLVTSEQKPILKPVIEEVDETEQQETKEEDTTKVEKPMEEEKKEIEEGLDMEELIDLI